MIMQAETRISRYACMVLVLWLAHVGIGVGQDFSQEQWHNGTIQLENDETISGALQYNFKLNTLQCNVGEQLFSYTAGNALSFEIFDQLEKYYRTFYAIPFSEAGDYRKLHFFELLLEGEMTLLCREHIERVNRRGNYGVTPFYYTVREERVYYYLLSKDGTVTFIKNKKKDWLDRMGRYQEHVLDYVRNNRLKFENKADIIKIVAYYNTLIK